jgi:hypothetical protein
MPNCPVLLTSTALPLTEATLLPAIKALLCVPCVLIRINVRFRGDSVIANVDIVAAGREILAGAVA